MSYNLFLDDEREVGDVKWVNLPLVCWTIVRNYNNFVKTISDKGLPNIITFDHDLGEEAYKECRWTFDQRNLEGGAFNYKNLKGEKTGFDCAKWLVDYCLDKKLNLPEYYIHSLNPIGSDNIKSLLESYRKSLKNI